LIGGIWPLPIEATLEASDVGLDDGTNSVIEGIDHTWIVASNMWQEASRNTVAQVCGEHSGKRISGLMGI